MRLFVTVGTQVPFDRLVRTVDAWVAENGGGVEAFAQVGPCDYRPRHMQWAEFIDAGECRRQVQRATAVVAHAGMGSIITALELGKPIIVMPRRANLGEHRNDHQLATARSLLSQGKVTVAFDEGHLVEKLQQMEQLLAANRRIAKHASPRLIAALRQFISTGERVAAAGTGVAVETGLSVQIGELARDRRPVSSQPSGLLLNS
jgi:UDP-N-acetylglucosamine transferase subunit ALG13